MQSKDRGAEEYREVFYENLCPKGFRKRLDEMPIAYLPLGTLEWHGPHLPLGADGIQSKGLFKIMAEEVGGIVLPSLFVGDKSVVPWDRPAFVPVFLSPGSIPPHL